MSTLFRSNRFGARSREHDCTRLSLFVLTLVAAALAARRADGAARRRITMPGRMIPIRHILAAN